MSQKRPFTLLDEDSGPWVETMTQRCYAQINSADKMTLIRYALYAKCR